MSRILIMFLLVTAIATWTVEAIERDKLTKRLDQARMGTRFLMRVQAENEALVRRQPFVGEIESLRRDRVELNALRRELVQQEQSTMAQKGALSALGREILPQGLWLPTTAMNDLGRATPHAALQTLFWAARTDRPEAMKDLVAFEKQPGGADVTEVLRAIARTVRHGDVQVMAERLKGFDEAAEFLALRTADGRVTTFYLRLRWEPGGWRVIVPAHAMPGGTPAPVNHPLRAAPKLPEP